MSENLDLVRSIYAGWERGDFVRWAEWADPQIVFEIADGPEPGIRTGLRAMAESWRGWLSGWEDFRLEAEEYRELDGERVVVLHHYWGRGKASGLEIGDTWTKAATLFHVHNGKVTRLVGYNERERALADLGLAE
jgi:ketosteroid isomerase-like protein